MTDAQSIKDKITTLTNVIGAAKAALKSDDILDLSGLEKEIVTLCENVKALGEGEARGLRDSLVSLSDEISRLEDDIRNEHEKTAGELGNLSIRQKATQAYGGADATPAPTPQKKK